MQNSCIAAFKLKQLKRGSDGRTNFSDLNRPHDRYERAPTRGRPSAGCWGNRWQTRRLNSLNSLNSLNFYSQTRRLNSSLKI